MFSLRKKTARLDTRATGPIVRKERALLNECCKESVCPITKKRRKWKAHHDECKGKLVMPLAEGRVLYVCNCSCHEE